MSAANEAARLRLAEIVEPYTGPAAHLVDALLVVARQMQAEALEDAAEDLPATPGLQYVAHDWLRRRAGSLRSIR